MRLASDLAHPVNVLQHRSSLPPLDDVGRHVVETLARGEVAMVPIDDLRLPSTAAMEIAGQRILGDIEAELRREGRSGGLPSIRTATSVPELRTWAHEPSLLAIAQHYIGLPVAFQGVHARLEQANDSPVTTELWHRDVEDRRMLKCFVHLDEVTVDHGPFEFVRDMDLSKATLRRVRAAVRAANRRGAVGLDDTEMSELVGRAAWRSSPVPARTVVFADPTALYHHGRRRTLNRPALFFVYTSAFPRRPHDCRQYWDDRFPAA